MGGRRAVRTERPGSREEAAEALRSAAAAGLSARPRGGGTKLGWGRPVTPDVEIETGGLSRIVAHNAEDLTAVLEAGVSLAAAREALAGAGQMLALDPPLGSGEAATVGGAVAAADSGPLRHRYGAARDLLLGITVALADGTVARSGGTVIKNVAGYDLAKLFAGSFGTLGLILEVAVRLHPLPPGRATAVGSADDPAAIGRAALALAHAPLELEALDVGWEEGSGRLLARAGGAAAGPRAQAAARLMAGEGLEAEVVEDDRALWEAQRAGQRSLDGTVLRVSALPAELPRVLAAAERAGAAVVGRAGLGISWLRLEGRGPEDAARAVADVRADLRPFPCAVLDAPDAVRGRVEPWDGLGGPALGLMRRVKARFDPSGACNPGALAEGL